MFTVEKDSVVLDKKDYYEMKEKAELNQEGIDKLAEEKFKRYISTEGIKLEIVIREPETVLLNRQTMVVESNYGERGYEDPLPEQLGQGISDQILEIVNERIDEKKGEIMGNIDEWKKKFAKKRNKKITSWQIMSGLLLLLYIISIVL